MVMSIVLLLVSPGCGDREGASGASDDGGGGGEIIFPGETITGQGTGNGFSEPFRSDGCDVELSMTHADDSRFLLFIIDKTDGSAFKTIVFTNSISDEAREVFLPEGDYWVEVETTGSWSISITGCIYTFLDPDDYETDVGLYIGCPPPCCEEHGGVFGCDCVAGRCICNDDTFSNDCACTCVGGSDDPGLVVEGPELCRGCCIGHGGVTCVGETTQCADGTPMSNECHNIGCDACN
jgi:hypothetical protein